MGWSKPFDEVETEYIENHYPTLSCATIAAKLGRSERGVRNAVKRLGLAEPRPPAPARSNEDARACAGDAPVGGDPGGGCGGCEPSQDELAELREIKRVLKRALRSEIDPKDMPKLSAELREVIRRISELEGDGDGGSGALAGTPGSLVVSIPLRPA